jgi:hypothetical protein
MMFRQIILALGGKKFAAMVAGLVAQVILAVAQSQAGRFGFVLPDSLVQSLQLKVTAIVIALILGQSLSEALTGGATSSSEWPEAEVHGDKVKDAAEATKVLKGAE